MVNDLEIKTIHVKKMIKAINKLRERNNLTPISQEENGASSKQSDYRNSNRSSSTGSDVREDTTRNTGSGGRSRSKSSSTKYRQKNVGAWRRGHLIGQGAYGKVYQGFSLEDGSLIAVKQILTTMDDETRREVENEISVMSRLKHECIVRYLGYQWVSKKVNDSAANVVG